MTPVASTGTRHGLGDAGKPEALRVRLFGGFQISVGPRNIGEDGWRLRKAASLVKLLALSPGHRLHREVAMDLLWPDLGTRSAANNLRGALHAVRRTLEPTTPSRYLQLSGEELVLCPDGLLWVDVDAFEEAAATSRYSREPAAYRAAIELYTGELLPEDRYEEWAEDRRENLRGTYLALLSELSMLYQEREEYGRAIQALRNLLSEEPADEEAHAGLMRLYALSGRRGEALRQYELLEKALRRELGAEPSAENRRLREEILSGRFPPLRPPAEDRPSGEIPGAGPHNLPVQRSSFVGRERDIVEIKQLLSMTGLLTLTGTGGSGKTRLALEVARDLVGLYPDGVWLVELAPLSEEALVPQEVASTLGIHEQPGRPLTDTLIRTMRQKKLLLVLDNCEHLIDAAARLVDTLLDSCPRLKILATSREPLGVAGEANWKVPTLSVPDAERLPAAEDLTRYESVRLFEERAHLKLPAFEITPDNTRSVAEVCRRLDGIPLAIELATARMGTLAVEQVAERLEDSLKFLTGGARTASPRQQTMRAALEWSYELLIEAEKRLFERLSVFVGGWTLEAAEAVGDGRFSNPPVLDLLCGLVEKSLVVVEASSSVETLHATSLRYRMLEPVRQYGSEKLRESTEEREVRRRHAEHYLSLAERAESELSGPCSPEWLDWFEIEHDNLREALRWSLDSERPELGLRMGAALWWFWYVRGYLTEGRRWLEEHLSRSGPGYSRVRTRAFNGAGNLAMWQGEFEDAKGFLLEALSLSRERKDEEGVANSLVHLAAVGLLGQRDDISVPVLLEEAAELRPKVKDRRTLSNLLLLSAVVVAMRGDLDRSKALHEESLALFREVGDIPGISQCLNTLGLVTLASRDYDKASALFREDLRISWESDHKVTIQTSLIGLGGVSTSWGQPARAARLWGAAKAMEETFGIRVTPAGLSLAGYEGYLATARSRLDEEEFAVAWAEGMAMTTKEAVEYALSEETARPTASEPPFSESGEGLTRMRAKALNGAGYLAIFQGEYEATKELLEGSLALYRELGDKEGIVSSLTYLCLAAVYAQQDLETVPALLEEAASFRPEIEDQRTIAMMLLVSGLLAVSLNDRERAEADNEEGLQLFREIRDMRGMSMCTTNLGLIALSKDEHPKASALLKENLHISRGPDHKAGIHYSLFGLAGVAARRGQPARAAKLWGAAEAMRETFGIHLNPMARRHLDYEGDLMAARLKLSEEVFTTAWAEGKAMTQGEAVEYGLEVAEPDASETSVPEGEPSRRLTRREREVAALVGRGITNRLIAAELSISERTVESHVRNILKKLGLSSRAQLAALVTRRPMDADRG